MLQKGQNSGPILSQYVLIHLEFWSVLAHWSIGFVFLQTFASQRIILPLKLDGMHVQRKLTARVTQRLSFNCYLFANNNDSFDNELQSDFGLHALLWV